MKKEVIIEQTTLIQIYYYMPDYPSVLNEFNWQTIDLYPRFPRIKRFLDYWHTDIEAVINTINLVYNDPYYGANHFRNITHESKFQ
jgi:uncharacterized protein Usg